MHESKMRMVIEGHTVTILCKYNIKGGEARVTIHRLSLEKSRRYGISLTGTGKELKDVLTHQANMVQHSVKSFPNMVYSFKKSKNYVICSELQNVNSATRSLLQVT